MGAWGYQPFENDSALDWLGDIERKIALSISQISKSEDAQHETMAAAQLLLDLTAKSSAHLRLRYDALNWRGGRICSEAIEG